MYTSAWTCTVAQQAQQEAQERVAREKANKLAAEKKKREEDVCARPDAGGQVSLELWVSQDRFDDPFPSTMEPVMLVLQAFI